MSSLSSANFPDFWYDMTPPNAESKPFGVNSENCYQQIQKQQHNQNNNINYGYHPDKIEQKQENQTQNLEDFLQKMDACEIANFLANELFLNKLVSVNGIQSGVPTLTTSTLTPTTLRSIEETFIQLTSEPLNAPYQAGFIPPPLAFSSTSTTNDQTAMDSTNLQKFTDINDSDSENSQSSWNMNNLNEENSLAATDSSSAATDTTSFQNGFNGLSNNSLTTSNASSTNDFSAVNIAIAAAAGKSIHNNMQIGSNLALCTTSDGATTTYPARRNHGGRRPAKSSNMSPEEEEKRRVRRERNKLAAARCRKRRVDQTNDLLEEVAQLEIKREGLQNEIESLSNIRRELDYILESHRPTCQKIRQDLLSVNTFGGLIAPTRSISNAHSDDSEGTITGLDSTLSSTGRSISPIDLKPVILNDSITIPHIKSEPLDSTLDSNSCLESDGPSSPKRLLLSNNNHLIPPLPHITTLSASLAAAASINTPVVTTAPISFGSLDCSAMKPNNNSEFSNKQRPNTLPTVPRIVTQSIGLNIENKAPTDINGVAIQTPSTGMFNFDSLMDGGTGLTPVSGPLIPTCSSQNKHPLELTTPTSEPSKLVSL